MAASEQVNNRHSPAGGAGPWGRERDGIPGGGLGQSFSRAHLAFETSVSFTFMFSFLFSHSTPSPQPSSASVYFSCFLNFANFALHRQHHQSITVTIMVNDGELRWHHFTIMVNDGELRWHHFTIMVNDGEVRWHHFTIIANVIY